jgi:hypothetical protein
VGLSVSNLDRKHQLEHLIGDLQALPFGFEILLGGTAADEVHAALPSRQGCPRRHDIQEALAAV